MKQTIKTRIALLTDLIQEKNLALQNVPEGILRASSHRNSWQYYLRSNKHEKSGKYLRKDQLPLIKSLAQKQYDKKILDLSEKELKLLSKLDKLYNLETIEDVFSNFPLSYQSLISPIEEPLEEYIKRWSSQTYETKAFPDDSPYYYSEKREKMRSKSEILIANALKRFEIPYLYEKPLYLKKYGTVYPDFTILDTKNRCEIFWEHLGLMDNPEYCEKALSKITLYEQNGYFPGKKLILSHETSKQPLNTLIIEQLIKNIPQY